MRERGSGEPTAADNRADQQNYTRNAGSGNSNLTWRALEHVPTHQNRDGNGHADGENSPGAVGQGVDHNDAESGQRDQQNEQQSDHGDQAGEGADLGTGHVGQGFSFVPYRGHQHGKVVNTAAEDGANQDPEEAGSKAELGSQGWSN